MHVGFQKNEYSTQKGFIFQRFHLGPWDLKTNDLWVRLTNEKMMITRNN
jgi:hypothetical protein